MDCGFFADLPDDVFGLISGWVSHRDLCNLSATCKRLREACNSDKLWLPQCEGLIGDSSIQLSSWRNGVHSYKALFRFLAGVRPLVGIWVHQNPELGNLVYVTWGFISVVGCRVIPQELNPRGIDSGLLWAPVFEIISLPDGSPAFFLHGRDRDDFCYPGRFDPAGSGCNVLLLEAESFPEPGMLVPNNMGEEDEMKGSTGDRRSVVGGAGLFGRLSFGDRRRLLEVLVSRVRIRMPALAQGPMFSTSRPASRKELKSLSERNALMLWMYIHGDPCCGAEAESDQYHRVLKSGAVSRLLQKSFSSGAVVAPVSAASAAAAAEGPTAASGAMAAMHQQQPSSRKYSFASFVRSKMRQIIRSGHQGGGGFSQDSCKKRTAVEAGVGGAPDNNNNNNNNNRRLQLHEYLQRTSGVGLRLHAATLKLTLYRAWPIISENRFALYKLPEQKAKEGREFAGLWGATFGWPPGKPGDDRAGKALFFLLLSYDETEQGRVLIATKILEGTHYVLHPNGSAMFTAKVDEPSGESFPWECGPGLEIVGCFFGEGIANGYGFRYPGVKPGDLFVTSGGLLAFVWRESRAVLALQRFDLREMLRKGEKVAALPPIANFAYLTKANSNVFAGPVGWRSFGR